MSEEDPLILVLYNQESKVAHGEPRDILALQYTANVAVHINQALVSRGYQTVTIAVRDSLDELREILKAFSPKTTFIFNNCDGFGGENMAATKVVRLIEYLGFKHTGSTANVTALCIDKQRTKQRLIKAGVPTPKYQVYTKLTERYECQFPAIVKPMTDDASIGIDLKSVIVNQQELSQRVSYIIGQYHQPALVEEFIPGRELTVSLWGNGQIEALPVSEQDFSRLPNPLHHILTYEAKWILDSYLAQNVTTHCPADLNPGEKKRVITTATRAFRAVGLRDFGRVDIRYHDGIPYVIDINEVPDLAPEAGFSVSAHAAGYTYAEMIEHILMNALQRESRKCKQTTLKPLSPRLQTAKAFLK